MSIILVLVSKNIIGKDNDFKSIIICLHINKEMAFEIASPGSVQIDPTFAEGKPYPAKYHNVGQLMTPYEGKKMGQGGDYGPPQSTTYYSLENPVYPYPLDEYSYSSMCLPKMCYPDYPPKYPWTYVPGNYFVTQENYPDMGKVRTRQSFNTHLLGTVPSYHMNNGNSNSKKERYGGRDSRKYAENDAFLYRRLPTTPGPSISNANYYPPFNNFY